MIKGMEYWKSGMVEHWKSKTRSSTGARAVPGSQQTGPCLDRAPDSAVAWKRRCCEPGTAPRI
jgi:hypothetical protein